MRLRILSSGMAAVAAATLSIPASAGGDFNDDFESYNVGQGVAAQSADWEEWCQSSGVDALVSNNFAHSGTKSIHLNGDDDIVHRVNGTTGVTSGVWTVSVWIYCPTPNCQTANDAYVILMNTYLPANCQGTYQSPWWSSQVRLDMCSQNISETDTTGGNNVFLPLNQWGQIRVEIDLDNNLYSAFYNDGSQDFAIIEDDQWADAGQEVRLAVLDIYFATGGTNVYYDDVEISGPPQSVATINSLTVLEGAHVSGGVPQIISSNNQYYVAEAAVTGEAAEANRLRVRIDATSAVAAPTSMSVTYEGSSTDPNTVYTVFMRRWSNNTQVQVGTFNIGLSEQTRQFNVTNPSRFVRAADRAMEVELKGIVVLPSSLAGFLGSTDLFEVTTVQ